MIQARFVYGLAFPSGHFGDLHGQGFSLNSEAAFITKGQWNIGLSGELVFGNRVKEDVLSGLRTDDGGIIGTDAFFADLQPRTRALAFGLQAGRIWLLQPNRNRSGLLTALWGGWMGHKIRFQPDPQSAVTQVEDAAYQKGYDRLYTGPAIGLNVAYQYLSANRRINFFVALDYKTAFTQMRRQIQFDRPEVIFEKATDGLLSLRLGWILPFYTGENPDELQY